MKNRYCNPWHKTLNVPKPEFYENNAPMIFEYRGVKVFCKNVHSFDFVLSGTCITQRAGFSHELTPGLIDDILDGRKPVANEVAAHLISCGHSPLSYAQT